MQMKSDNFSSKFNFMLGLAIVGTVICLLLYLVVSFALPHNWHYTTFYLVAENNKPSIPFAFFAREPNVMIINGTALMRKPVVPHLLRGTSKLQVSGVGFRGSDIDIEKISTTVYGFSSAYHYLHTSPRLFFSDGQTSQVFQIRRLWWNSYEFRVGDEKFQTKRQIPLILLIEECGNVVEIESFAKTFGITLDAFLKEPIALLPLANASPQTENDNLE